MSQMTVKNNVNIFDCKKYGIWVVLVLYMYYFNNETQ
jgi:hypothetical protein